MDSEQPRTGSDFFLDEVTRLHVRLDDMYTRLRRLEEGGKSGSDPMQSVMVWMAVAYVVSAFVPPLLDMISQWRQQKCE